jgi:hypothetical protein
LNKQIEEMHYKTLNWAHFSSQAYENEAQIQENAKLRKLKNH